MGKEEQLVCVRSSFSKRFRIWFGHGRWDYSRQVDGRTEGAAYYHAELYSLSNRGVALDKDGTGFKPGRTVTPHQHTIAAGRIRPAILSGCLGPSKVPGCPNSRGRLSLNLYTGPPTKHHERTGVTPARKKST